MEQDRAFRLYLPIAGFNIEQLHALVISKPVQEYVDGLFIDQFTALDLGTSGLRTALRIHGPDYQEGREQPHALKIALEFPTPVLTLSVPHALSTKINVCVVYVLSTRSTRFCPCCRALSLRRRRH
jgi:hypothetical protein